MDGQCIQGGHAGQRDDSFSWWANWEDARFHHAIEDSMKFKTYELFIFEMFHVYIFLLIYLKTFKFKQSAIEIGRQKEKNGSSFPMQLKNP